MDKSIIIKDIKTLYDINKALAIQAAKVLGLKIVSKSNPAVEERDRNRLKLEETLPSIKKKLKNIGYDLEEQIAPGGRYGAAFNLGNKKILKITLDPAEAEATDKVKEYNLKHSVNVYRIFKFKDLKDFYFLEQERLLPINKLEKRVVTALKRLLKYSKHPLPTYKKYAKSFDRIKDPESYTLLKSSKDKFKTEVLGFLIKILEDGKISSKELKPIVIQSEFTNQLFDTINEFRQAGITKLDLHAGNVMRDSEGIVKLIDFGFRIEFTGF